MLLRKKPAVAKEAQAAARTKIEHKLAVLAWYQKHGVPEGKVGMVPTSLNRFCEWEDAAPGNGMQAVVRNSKATLFYANRDLKAQVESLVEHFRTSSRRAASRKETRKSEVRRLRDIRDLQDDQIALLLSQWTAERERVRELERELESANTRIRNLKQIRDDLRGQLSEPEADD